MRWFTSDTHFWHKKILEYDNRPFKDLYEMEMVIVKNWNNLVSRKDIVYHLGDFAFGNPRKCGDLVRSLNGHIILVRGNHDIRNGYTHKRCVSDGGILFFSDISDIEETTINCERIVLSHYPYSDERFPQRSPVDCGNWLIHGHCHNNIPKVHGRQINICCSMWNYSPVSEKQIWEIIKEKNGTI